MMLSLSEKEEAVKVLIEGLSSLFIDKKYSDLNVVSGETIYQVHKAVLCTQSTFFSKACGGGFKEAKTGVITLPDDDPQRVKLMMHYFYHLDYPHIKLQQSDGKQGSKDENGPNLAIHAHVYTLAEKYGVMGLMAVALKKFVADADVHWGSEDFFQSVEYIYNATPEHDHGLRDAVKKSFFEHRSEVATNDDAKKCLREVPDLACDLFIHACDRKNLNRGSPVKGSALRKYGWQESEYESDYAGGWGGGGV